MGSINQRLIKLKQGQKTAFPFPLMVSPLQTSSLNPYSLPFFIPLHFACRRRPNPVHLFAHFSIAMFTGFNFTPFFYLYLFGYLVSKFIRMSLYLKLSAFDDIKYLLLVLLGSALSGLPKPFTLILFVLILSKASRAVTLCNSPAFIFTYLLLQHLSTAPSAPAYVPPSGTSKVIP